MKMRIAHDPPEEGFPINMTNMIDVFLMLLIFFLVATTFAREERDARVQLPGTAAVRPISAPPHDLVINILQNGALSVSGTTLSTSDLSTVLTRVAKEEPDRNVLIRADERSLMKYFATVARLCREAGVSELKIGYVVEKPPGS
jgi:biopolymer transport protein ExbD